MGRIPEAFRRRISGHKRRPSAGVLTPYWEVLRPHRGQYEFFWSAARFNLCHAGRRAGKTLIALERHDLKALNAPPGSNTLLAAPTWGQTERIFADRFKRLMPARFIAGGSKSSDNYHFRLTNGVTVWLIPGTAAHRFEGLEEGIYHATIDEMGNMPPRVWQENIYPQIAQTGGTADFIGVPEGRNHYFDLAERARAEREIRDLIAAEGEGAASEGLRRLGLASAADLSWDIFAWRSRDILPLEEIEAMKRNLDAALFDQEEGGQFVTFEGRVYKPFTRESHCRPVRQLYNPRATLYFALDFNVEPGVAAVVQELEVDGELATCVIGEVYIPRDSTTAAVCRRLCEDWEGHAGPLGVYGDATGGSRRSSADAGMTDWVIVANELGRRFSQMTMQHDPLRARRSNPAERDRINCMLSRLETADGARHLYVDPTHAPQTVRDLEAVRYKPGTSQIWKGTDPVIRGTTHLTDGLGYYVAARHPIPDLTADQTLADRFVVA